MLEKMIRCITYFNNTDLKKDNKKYSSAHTNLNNIAIKINGNLTPNHYLIQKLQLKVCSKLLFRVEYLAAFTDRTFHNMYNTHLVVK
ncbi:hypothetical protein D3C85_1193920 [compost metagenome]